MRLDINCYNTALKEVQLGGHMFRCWIYFSVEIANLDVMFLSF